MSDLPNRTSGFRTFTVVNNKVHSWLTTSHAVPSPSPERFPCFSHSFHSFQYEDKPYPPIEKAPMKARSSSDTCQTSDLVKKKKLVQSSLEERLVHSSLEERVEKIDNKSASSFFKSSLSVTLIMFSIAIHLWEWLALGGSHFWRHTKAVRRKYCGGTGKFFLAFFLVFRAAGGGTGKDPQISFEATNKALKPLIRLWSH